MPQITIPADTLRRRMDCMDGEVVTNKELAARGIKFVGIIVDAVGTCIVLEGHSEHLEFLVPNTSGM